MLLALYRFNFPKDFALVLLQLFLPVGNKLILTNEITLLLIML
jgi:hypothetical protein